MTGVKFSRFTFKGIVYKKSRTQTRRGVVAPPLDSLWDGGVFWY